MTISPAACKDTLWQHKSTERGCFHLLWDTVTDTPILYDLMSPCTRMKLRLKV